MSWIQDILNPKRRVWEEFYRNRFSHDRVMRSTHGNNCTGGCSWLVFVKDGIVVWELQALDYPKLEPSLPPYEPRGCQRGICYSWYLYSPVRVKYPYIRGRLLDLWRAAREKNPDLIACWASIVEDDEARRSYQNARGKGGFRRAGWDEALDMIAASLLHTARKYGPDRVAGFSPTPAMSMLSYSAGSRFLQLFGASVLSFYDLYADFPPVSPETWGEKTDVAESADWYNSKFIVVTGCNLSMTRTPDVHFAVEARNHGAKLVVLSPDFSQISKYSDWWLPVRAGMDGAFWMAVNHVLLREFSRRVPYFADYLKRYSDAPFLVSLEREGEVYRAGRLLRAGSVSGYENEEHADWKFVVMDESGKLRMPQGSIGHRWQKEKGKWNLEMKDGVDETEIRPVLSLYEAHDDELPVRFEDFGDERPLVRYVPVRHITTGSGRNLPVATVLDLLTAQCGVNYGFNGEYPEDYDDETLPYTPAWQEKFTGISRKTVVDFAREWGRTAEKTGGKCTIVIGSGISHWYHSNLMYRAAVTSLILCGCVGVNGGGLNHYTGQEKVAPASSWVSIAMALDWSRPPRLQNGPSFLYVHGDQWRYEGEFPDHHPQTGAFARRHAMDLQIDAVRMGWLPFYPQFDRNPVEVVRQAEAAGARTEEEIVAWVVEELKNSRLRFAVEDPDAPENWPRVWFMWRANALLASAKGHEYLLRHYLGTHSGAIAEEAARGMVENVRWREPAPSGKMDLVVDLNFRADTSALYSDIILPAAGWYEKNDLNTTDLHSFIHPMGEAVPPCWESRTDWDIFRSLARRVSILARKYSPLPFKDIVASALQHDTPDEIAQPEVKSWYKGECEAIPGKTMPHFKVVERDYTALFDRFVSYGPLAREHGVEDHGVKMPIADLYDQYLETAPVHEWNGRRYPSLFEAEHAIEVLLRFAPETNGEIALRGFRDREQSVGLPLADLAEGNREVRYDFENLVDQPHRLLTSPCWSGIMNGGRAYSAYCMNVERLVPWRTLTGRQHFYLDHEGYRAFEENLVTFKPKIAVGASLNLARSGDPGESVVLNCITPHGKWHIHTTYADTPTMMTLSRGINPFWLNERDAERIGVRDNDWIEAFNDNGAVVTRAVVSARIPRGICIFYHAAERTLSVPKSPMRGNRRAGGHNSLTRLRLKPVLMAGGYGQHCYRFNDYGPPASDRDTWVRVRRLPEPPVWR